MLIWCLFDDNLISIVFIWLIWSISVKICKVNDSPNIAGYGRYAASNTSGQACTFSEGHLWFAWFINAKRSKCFSMYAASIIRTWGFKLAITVFAFETQNRSVCLQPQNVQRVSLSKLVPTRHWNSCRTRPNLVDPYCCTDGFLTDFDLSTNSRIRHLCL